MSSRRAAGAHEKRDLDWIPLDGSSLMPQNPGWHRSPPSDDLDSECESGLEGTSLESLRDHRDAGDGNGALLRKSREPMPRSRPKQQPPEHLLASSAEHDDSASLCRSLDGLSLANFLPSENGVDVRLVIYDTETTGLGATRDIKLLELGKPLSRYSFVIELTPYTHTHTHKRRSCGRL